METESLVELNLGVTPEAAVSGAVLLQTEETAFLSFNAMRDTTRPTPHGGFYKEEAGTAVVELVHCSITKFGYPNDEAWSGIPRTRGLGYGIFEVTNSRWKEELVRLNQFSFPETREWIGRHFVFLFHDSSFECIAQYLRLEVSREPFAELISKVVTRALS
jgi:hypothetical protein